MTQLTDNYNKLLTTDNPDWNDFFADFYAALAENYQQTLQDFNQVSSGPLVHFVLAYQALKRNNIPVATVEFQMAKTLHNFPVKFHYLLNLNIALIYYRSDRLKAEEFFSFLSNILQEDYQLTVEALITIDTNISRADPLSHFIKGHVHAKNEQYAQAQREFELAAQEIPVPCQYFLAESFALVAYYQQDYVGVALNLKAAADGDFPFSESFSSVFETIETLIQKNTKLLQEKDKQALLYNKEMFFVYCTYKSLAAKRGEESVVEIKLLLEALLFDRPLYNLFKPYAEFLEKIKARIFKLYDYLTAEQFNNFLYYTRGIFCLALGKYAQAINDIETAFAKGLAQNHDGAYHVLAGAYYAEENYEKAFACYINALFLDEKNNKNIQAMLSQLITAARFVTDEQINQGILQIVENTAITQFGEPKMIHSAMHFLSAAITQNYLTNLAASTQQADKKALLFYMIGINYLKEKDYKKAISYFDYAMSSLSEKFRGAAYNDLAFCHYELKNYKAAADAYVDAEKCGFTNHDAIALLDDFMRISGPLPIDSPLFDKKNFIFIFAKLFGHRFHSGFTVEDVAADSSTTIADYKEKEVEAEILLRALHPAENIGKYLLYQARGFMSPCLAKGTLNLIVKRLLELHEVLSANQEKKQNGIYEAIQALQSNPSIRLQFEHAAPGSEVKRLSLLLSPPPPGLARRVEVSAQTMNDEAEGILNSSL